MKLIYHFLFSCLAILLITLVSCQPTTEATEHASQSIDLTGKWRGVFNLNNSPSPFMFELNKSESGNYTAFLINAEERFELNDVQLKSDSIYIGIDVYDALLLGRISNDTIHGAFRRNQDGVEDVHFIATHNQQHRFTSSTIKSNQEADGNWEIELTIDSTTSRKMIGVFKQDNEIVTGTLLSRTGDYRYFEGIIDGDSLKLSAFSGASPYLILAHFDSDSTLTGSFITSSNRMKIQAKRTDSFELENPYSLTSVNEAKKFEFTFPNLAGEEISLSDKKFDDKVVIVTIMGTWCPNCVDEAAFLAPWYEENKHRGIEVIALSFERKDDFSYAKNLLTKFVNRFNVTYEVLFGGKASRENVLSKLPALDGVIAYPTTIFIDSNKRVRKIHTGFYGPATGAYYDDFVEEFNAVVDELITEKEL